MLRSELHNVIAMERVRGRVLRNRLSLLGVAVDHELSAPRPNWSKNRTVGIPTPELVPKDPKRVSVMHLSGTNGSRERCCHRSEPPLPPEAGAFSHITARRKRARTPVQNA